MICELVPFVTFAEREKGSSANDKFEIEKKADRAIKPVKRFFFEVIEISLL
jgi:hypothetical protein